MNNNNDDYIIKNHKLVDNQDTFTWNEVGIWIAIYLAKCNGTQYQEVKT